MLSRPFPVNGTTSGRVPSRHYQHGRGAGGATDGDLAGIVRIQRTKTPAVRPGLLPLYFRRVFAYADSDVIRNSETKAVRGGVQTMSAGCTCRCSCIPFSVDCGRLPSVRRTAPVSPLRGCPGNASSFGGEAGTGGAKLSWPLPR